MREGGTLPDLPGKNYYLVNNPTLKFLFETLENYEEWFIQPDHFFMKGKTGGYFSNKTLGK